MSPSSSCFIPSSGRCSLLSIRLHDFVWFLSQLFVLDQPVPPTEVYLAEAVYRRDVVSARARPDVGLPPCVPREKRHGPRQSLCAATEVKVEPLFAVQAELQCAANWWLAPGGVLGAGVEMDALQRLHDVTVRSLLIFRFFLFSVLLMMIHTLHFKICTKVLICT